MKRIVAAVELAAMLAQPAAADDLNAALFGAVGNMRSAATVDAPLEAEADPGIRRMDIDWTLLHCRQSPVGPPACQGH